MIIDLKLKAIYGYLISDEKHERSIPLYIFSEGSEEEKQAEYYVTKVNKINKFDDCYAEFQELYIDEYIPEVSDEELNTSPVLRVEILDENEVYYSVVELQGEDGFIYNDGRHTYVTYFPNFNWAEDDVRATYTLFAVKHPGIFQKLKELNEVNDD